MSICFTPIVTAQVCFVLTSPHRAHRVTHQKEEGKRRRQHTLYAIAVLAISLSMITKHNLQYDARMIIYLDCWFIHWGETLASYTWVILIFVPTNCTSTLISILSIYSSNCNKTYWNCLYMRFSTSQKATLLMVCIRLQIAVTRFTGIIHHNQTPSFCGRPGCILYIPFPLHKRRELLDVLARVRGV